MVSSTSHQEAQAKLGGDDEVSALARGLSVLEKVISAAQPLTIKELSDETGIPRPTVARITSTLVSAGYLRQLPSKDRFVSTTAILELGNAFLNNFDMRQVVRPHLHELADSSGASVHLCIRNRLDMVVIESVRPSVGVVTIRLGLGDRLNIATSAIGRAYLANLIEDEREALIEAIRVSGSAEGINIRTVATNAVKDLKRDGYVSAFGDWNGDVNAIAVPVRSPAGERFAVNCGGPAFLFTREVLIDEIAPRLLETLRRIEADTGRIVLGEPPCDAKA
ncbi:IclR family transcriptional regulator [Burkholderia sp. PU8-34]